MEPLRPIFWGQGMFLQPQHFQQQDVYHEARLRRYMQLLQPFCWGVKSLSINETALKNYLFEVEQCELVSWEGTLIRFQAESLPSNARIAPRSFEGVLGSDGRPLAVYLGVKRLQWEGGNIAAPGLDNGALTETSQRFALHEMVTPDLFSDDGKSCPVHYLIHEVRLLFEGEATLQTQEYELVKVAELLRATEAPGAVLSKSYIPPCLSVHASPILEGMLRQVRDLLTAKGRELAEYKRQRGVHTIELGSRDTIYLLMMQMINRYIPLLHHHLEIGETHPCAFYGLLRQFIGEFSTFSETIAVLGGPLPAYRHDQLWSCFNAAVRVATELITNLTRGPEYVVSLSFDGEYYTADLARGFFDGNNRYYLSVKMNMPPRELERHLTDTGKVCSREEMAALRQRSLPGLGLRYLDTPPEELPRRAHCCYFELDHHSALWNRIEQRQNIAVYCQLPPSQTEMQVLVIHPT